MAFLGMDIEGVRALAQQFGEKAQTVEDVISTISGQVQSVDWKGTDADQFKSEWEGTLSSQLRNVADALRQAQTTANNNADEQEQASGGGAGGGGAGGVVGSSYGGGGVTGSSGSFGGGGGSAGITGSTGSFEDAGISGSSGSFGGAGVTGSSGSFAVSGIGASGKFGQQGVHVFGDGASPINYLPELPQLSTQYPTDFVEIPEHSVES